MELSKLFGLPAHPLLVHVPIVLIPLAALATVALVAVPRLRPQLGPITVGLAAIAAVGVQLALGSGEALEPHVRRSALLERHTQLADALRPLVLVFLVVLVVLVVLHRRPPSRAWLVPLVSVLAIISGLGATVRTVQVGHAGARATWHATDMTARARDSDGR